MHNETWIAWTRSRLLALALGVVASTIPLGITEVVLRLAVHGEAIDDIEYSGNYEKVFFEPDALLGYRPPSRSHLDSTKRVNGELVYITEYTTDEYHRRRTLPFSEDGRDFTIFFGDSFTFGEGVRDDETYSSQFAQAAPGMRVYNYGVPGYGPQQTLALLTERDLRAEVGGGRGRGRAVYLFIDNHIPRAIGSLLIYAWWGRNFPYYTLEGDALVHRGTFRSGRPIRSRVYDVLALSRIVWYIPLDWPRPIRSEHVDLTARILAASRDAFAERFGNDDFTVMLYPGVKYGQRLAEGLEARGVRTLDYSELFDVGDPAYRFLDRHPTALAHHVLAEQLLRDLDLVPAARDQIATQ